MSLDEDKLEQIFSIIDQNGSGRIRGSDLRTLAELQQEEDQMGHVLRLLNIRDGDE